MSKVYSFFKGLFWGGLIAGAVVLLYTPYKGEEFSTRVKEYLEHVKDEIKEAGEVKQRELEEQLALLRSGKE